MHTSKVTAKLPVLIMLVLFKLFFGKSSVGTAVGCLLTTTTLTTKKGRCWGENATLPAPAAAPLSDPKQPGSSPPLWKQADRKGKHQGVDRASSFGGLISHTRAPARFQYSSKSEDGGSERKHPPSRGGTMVWWWEGPVLLLSHCEGDVWYTGTSRGQDRAQCIHTFLFCARQSLSMLTSKILPMTHLLFPFVSAGSSPMWREGLRDIQWAAS